MPGPRSDLREDLGVPFPPSAGAYVTRRRFAVVLCAICALFADALLAQATGTLRGRVRNDANDQPLAHAEIMLESLRLSATSDSAGRFDIRNVPSGRLMVLVRCVGFSPLRMTIAFTDGDTTAYVFALSPVSQKLPGVEVREEKPVPPKLSEFEERRRAGFGRFITQDILEKNQGRRLSEIIALVPGPRVIRGSTSAAWVASSRGSGSMLNGSVRPTEMDRRKGAPQACYAAILLDGAFVFRGMDGEQLFDINTLSASTIAGIEYYPGPASTPAKFQGSPKDCGVMVIWTK